MSAASKFRDLLAACESVQVLLGVDGEANPVTAAQARIFLGMEDEVPARPCFVVGSAGTTNQNVGAPATMLRNGDLVWELFTEDVTGDDESAKRYALETSLEDLDEDIAALASTGTYLIVRSFNLESIDIYDEHTRGTIGFRASGRCSWGAEP